jgi:hypothetical protein
MRGKITRAKAEAALAAVVEQFKSYVEPTTMEAFTAEDGTEYPAETFGPTCPMPKLIEDWNGPGWVISWEEGPDDWAFRATTGGTSEEERILVASAAQEFGHDPQAAVARMKADEPITWPRGVEAEPYYSFVLSLYPA